MPEQVDKRVEYRVVGKYADGRAFGLMPTPHLNQAQASARGHEIAGGTEIRVQESTVTESRTPWEDVAGV